MEETKFNAENPLPQEQERKSELNRNLDFRSKITESIGHGDDAKNSIIYLTLKYCFISGCIITIIITVNFWIEKSQQNSEISSENYVSYITKGWQIVLPIITLALGYSFGQSKK